MEAATQLNPLTVVLGASFGMFLLTVVLILFFVVYQRRLYRQQEAMRLAEAKYQRELLRANEQSREREQQRIAQELHDGVGAMLSTTRMYVQQVQRLAGQEKGLEFADRADKLLEETIGSVRRISQDLKPMVLESLGLSEALKTLADKVAKAGQLQVETHLADPLPKLSEEQGLRLYRTVQELLSNVIKHAKARTVTLRLQPKAGQLVLSVQDDGRGFDPETLNGPDGQSGMGLRSLQSRAQLLGGTLVVDSTPGQGTHITLSFPQ